MNEKLVTDALRNPPWSNLDAVGALLEAAADEVDRLRAAVDASEYLASSNNHLWMVIERAPHDLACPAKQEAHWVCRCWKAQVL